MRWLFPLIKTTRTIEEQFNKILDEAKEYKDALTEEEKDKEAVDIIHSCETFLRLRFKGREDELEKLIQETILKNTKRGYYEQSCF